MSVLQAGHAQAPANATSDYAAPLLQHKVQDGGASGEEGGELMDTRVIGGKSALERIEYDEDTGLLTVWFKRGATWRYHGVPGEVYEEMVSSAGPIGSAFYRLIRQGGYRQEQVGAGASP